MAVAGIKDWESYFRGNPSPLKSAGRCLGAADYYVDGEHYIIKMDVPGIKIGDLNISVIDSKQIIIKGTKNCEYERGGEVNYLSYERAHGSFTRVFKLLDSVPCDIGSITAELVDGVLSVYIPVNDYNPPKQVDIPIKYVCQSNITLRTEALTQTEDTNEVSETADHKPCLRRSNRNRKINRSLSLN